MTYTVTDGCTCNEGSTYKEKTGNSGNDAPAVQVNWVVQIETKCGRSSVPEDFLVP